MAQIKSRWLSMYFLFLPGLVVAGFGALLPVAVEAIKNLLVIAVSRRGLVNYHDIQAIERCLILAERLPDDALYPVSSGRCPTVFLRDCQAKPRYPAVIAATQNGKYSVPAALRFFKHAPESRSVQ